MAPRAEGSPVLFTLLPGPGRKRTSRRYGYRLRYRNPDPDAAGCVFLWEVSGGRMPYQIAVERAASGRSSCTAPVRTRSFAERPRIISASMCVA